MHKPAALLAVLLAAGTLAVPTAQAQVRLGVKAGVSNSKIDGRFYESYAAKFGFHAGGLANYDVTGDGFFSIQPELLYSQKGYAINQQRFVTFNDSGVRQDVVFKDQGNVNYHYLDLPVLLRINARGLIFEAGPQLSYLLSLRNKVKSTMNDQQASNEQWSSTLKDARRLEWGYAAGLGYQFATGPLLGLRYNGSFTEFGKPGGPISEFNSARNVAYQLYAGYLFGGK